MQSGDASIVSQKPQAYRGAILCLHGLTGASLEVARLGEIGSRAGFYSSMPTLLGHARGEIRDLQKISLAQWLRDIEAEFLTLSRKSEGTPIVVCGLSFGAILSLYLAVTYPERVSAVYACSPPYLLRPGISAWLSVAGSYLPEGLLNYLGTVGKAARRPNRWALPRQSMERHSMAAVMRMMKLVRLLTPQLAKFHGKVVILQDPHDHHLAPESGSALAARLANAEVEVMLLPRGEHELTVGWRHEMVEARLAALLVQLLGKT